MVDDNGDPLVVYHGAPDVRGILTEGFKPFSRGGVYFFTDSQQVANSYATDVRAFDYQNAEPHTVPVYLSLQNPKVIDAQGKKWTDTERQMASAKSEGHDGVIITNTRDEYNTQGGGKSSTVYVAFKPTQVKSAMTSTLKSKIDSKDIGGGPNKGTFDPNNPNILYQTDLEAHRAAVENAVEQGLAVPDTVLQAYASEDWAQAEIQKRQATVADVSTFNNLNDFLNFEQAMDPVEHPLEYYAYLWEQGQKYQTSEVGRAEGNRRFIETMTKPALEQFLFEWAHNDGLTQESHALIQSGMKKMLAGENLSQEHYKKILDQIKHNPTFYREVLAGLGDEMQQQQLQREQQIDPEGDQTENLKNEISKLKKDAAASTRTLGNVQQEVDRLRRWLKDAETQKATSTAQLQDQVKSVKQELALQSKRKQVMDRLVRQVFKKPSASIAWDYQQKILDVQATVDMEHRQAVLEARQKFRQHIADNPDAQVSEAAQTEAMKKSVYEMPLSDLEQLATQIKELRTTGRAEQDLKRFNHLIFIQGEVAKIEKSVLQGETPKGMEGFGSKETSARSKDERRWKDKRGDASPESAVQHDGWW